jgi:hypothetical protein
MKFLTVIAAMFSFGAHIVVADADYKPIRAVQRDVLVTEAAYDLQIRLTSSARHRLSNCTASRSKKSAA